MSTLLSTDELFDMLCGAVGRVASDGALEPELRALGALLELRQRVVAFSDALHAEEKAARADAAAIYKLRELLGDPRSTPMQLVEKISEHLKSAWPRSVLPIEHGRDRDDQTDQEVEGG